MKKANSLSFSQFMNDMRQKSKEYSHLQRKERLATLSESNEFRRYNIFVKTRTRMILQIAFLPVAIILGGILYFHPELPGNSEVDFFIYEVNGYVLFCVMWAYILIASLIASKMAKKVAFNKIIKLNLLDSEKSK